MTTVFMTTVFMTTAFITTAFITTAFSASFKQQAVEKALRRGRGVTLIRFHGVFSPNSKLRKYVVPKKPVEEQENPKPKAYSMSWAQQLKRVFAIDIEKGEKCGGPVKIIASIEDPDVIQKILKHLWIRLVTHRTAHRRRI